MIPSVDRVTGNLPPGVHEATWEEMQTRYGFTSRRRAQLAGLKLALDTLREAGCRQAYIDGSFVTAKVVPNDFDACWEMETVDFDLLDQLDPVLLDWSSQRAAQKVKFGGELFIAETGADPSGASYLDFFQYDRDTGERKGIIAIDLGGLS